MSVNFKISPKRNSGSFIFFLAASFDKDFLLIINNVVPINYFCFTSKGFILHGQLRFVGCEMPGSLYNPEGWQPRLLT